MGNFHLMYNVLGMPKNQPESRLIKSFLSEVESMENLK